MEGTETPISTPQTSSESSTSNTQDLDDGSECGWRDCEDSRPIFYMGDEDGRFPTSGFYRNIDGQKIKVGVCAMSKKTNSKPMKEILGRLGRFEHLQIIVFEEEMIINSAVEDWPVVDALVSFFSTGFPLHKAIQYKNLHKPFVVNDLEAQYSLKDRREVYKILVREGISHPRYAVMNRDEDEKGEFEECEDSIEVNQVTFQRPFVEKPVDAEDHNIYIYFPVSAGGGCQRLFRKVGSRSSVYCSISRVRKTGSYIYEDFMPTDGTDVKVYTVGPDYAHAEARKSPALDGKVERDKDGKEIRYPVLLNAIEKMIARKVCMAFKQNVCGFDLLRTGGNSFVCDVNGFSFVKNSTKYYDDCANVLGTMIVRALAPQLHIPLVLGAAPEDIPVVPTTSGSMMELRCVIAVIRHGDRTPKQKMKMEVKHRRFFELFEKYNGYKKGHLKFKKPKQLQEVLDIARELLDESKHDANPDIQEKKAKLQQLKLVLEMYEFTGINRKIQLKYQPYGRPPTSSDDEHPKEPSLVLIVKWGGELTPAGKFQAEDLGKAFRTLYPGGQGEFETPGLGFLRLHSTFRHDLKIYASDEGRVQMTAAAFTKGLLALEGELTPILVSMVKSANTNGLLDKEGETSKYQHIVKEKLMDILNQDKDFTQEDYDKLVPTKSASQISAMKFIKNPRRLCDKVYEMVQEITSKIRTLKLELISRDLKLYHGESWELLIRRWGKLEKDFKLKTDNYDISKIPDIYDCIKYDLQHNQKTLQFKRAEELFISSKALADIVIPQEYGITLEEKLHISQSICTPLMRKVHSDLIQACKGIDDEESTRLNSKYSKGVASPERFVRTRLYFTSESHIHSLLNMLRYAGFCDESKDEQWKKAMNFLSNTAELNYMTQINIMMFEDPTKEATSPERFHIELHFSPGAYTSCDKTVMNPTSSGYRTSFFTRQDPVASTSGKKHNKDAAHKPADSEALIVENVIKEAITEESITDEITPPEGSEIMVTLNDGTKNVLRVEDQGISVDSESGIDVDTKVDVQDKNIKENQNTAEDDDCIPTKTRKTGEDIVENPNSVKDKKTDSDKKISVSNTDSSRSSTSAHSAQEMPSRSVGIDLDAAVGNVDDSGDDLEKEGILLVENLGTGEDDNPDELVFDDKLSDDEQSKTLTEAPVQDGKDKSVPAPRSPDPDIPEWDWGDSSSTDKMTSQSDTTIQYCDSETNEKTSTSKTEAPLSPKSVSKPISISPGPYKERSRKGSFDSIKTLEEKRSRSLEDEYKDGGIAMMEQHYRTIHLPIKKDFHHSVSSLLYLNPDAFRGGSGAGADSIFSYSAPQLYHLCTSDSAFDGFNMVPSLKPLETLHNTLTMRDMDSFLSRATTTKFFTPVSSPMFGTTPLPSPRCPELTKARSASGPSLPSSSNSSAGPSSPTSASTPVDFLSKLKLYIIDKTKQDTGETETEPDSATTVSSSAMSTPLTADSTLMSPNGPSAFKLVARSSSNQRGSQFKVTQVVENVPPPDRNDSDTSAADQQNNVKDVNKDSKDGDKVASGSKG